MFGPEAAVYFVTDLIEDSGLVRDVEKLANVNGFLHRGVSHDFLPNYRSFFLAA